MDICDIKPGNNPGMVSAEVVDISPVKKFDRFGKVGRLAVAMIQDSTGKVQLTLWDDEVDLIKTGDRINVIDGYAKDWRGELQLQSGKRGKIELIEK